MFRCVTIGVHLSFRNYIEIYFYYLSIQMSLTILSITCNQITQRNRKILTFYRAIAAIPPIVGALFLRELGTITDYSGLVGLAIAFCFPPLLYLASEKRLQDYGAACGTRYERMGKSKFAAMAMFWFGIISMVFCFILLTF